jgi:hypothetical protein
MLVGVRLSFGPLPRFLKIALLERGGVRVPERDPFPRLDYQLKKRLMGWEIEATDESEAIRKAAAEFKVPASKLHAVRRR